MARHSPVVKPVFHAPVRMEWTDEKLATLDQDQLLSLLENLDHQRAIGRIGGDDANALEARMTRLLSGRHMTKRRKLLAAKEAVTATPGTGA
jgi:hypothetical protein